MTIQADTQSATKRQEPESTQVLLIDSDDVDRRVVRRLIGNRFDILEASTGEEGMTLYRAHKPGCVLLD